MITTGVAGAPWRASVTTWGAIEPLDGRGSLDWYVASQERWHTPRLESTVRQRRIQGTAVVETRVRIPGGDAVQRIYSVADHGGLTIVEVDNDSPNPIAVAFDRGDLLTERPIGEHPIQGIELPPGSFVLPVGHQARCRVAWRHTDAGPGRLPSDIADSEQVVRGWLALAERGSRFEIPSPTATEAVIAARCQILLGDIADPGDDPAAFILAMEELSRLDEPMEPWVPEVAVAVGEVARQQNWLADAAIDAAGRLLLRADERRAVRDLERLRRRRHQVEVPRPDGEPPEGPAAIAWLEGSLVRNGDLLPDGIPAGWIGRDFAVFDLPVDGRGLDTVSFAIRWHGARPAVLWESSAAVPLSSSVVAPGWETTEERGEALWPASTGSADAGTAGDDHAAYRSTGDEPTGDESTGDGPSGDESSGSWDISFG